MKTVPTDNILASTLRAIGDGVISCDREGRVYMMNTIAEELTAWSEREATGRSLMIVSQCGEVGTRWARSAQGNPTESRLEVQLSTLARI